MPIYDGNALETLPLCEPIYRNVSSPMLRLMTENKRQHYSEMEESYAGVYTIGRFKPPYKKDRAIAVTNMLSCGAIICISQRSYLAIHLAGDTRAVHYFAPVIRGWVNDNVNSMFVVGATGVDATLNSLELHDFKQSIETLFNISEDDYTIYQKVYDIAVTYDRRIGKPLAPETSHSTFKCWKFWQY